MRKNITLQQAIDEFLQSRRANGLSAASLRSYSAHLHPFSAYFQGRALRSIKTLDLREYVIELRSCDHRYPAGTSSRPQISGGLSHESLRSYLRNMRIFWKWATAEYRLASCPFDGIKIPPAQKHEPKSITPDDMRKLLNTCDESDVMGLRDKCAVAFLADTGCRAGGLVGLKIEDLHLDELYCFVEEKGRKRRQVPFSPYTADLLSKWLAVRLKTRHTYVFYALSSTRIGQPLTTSGLHLALKRRAKAAGVEGRYNAHSFRHGYARTYLLNGGDLATLSQLMGHSSVQITATNYARFTASELQRKHAQFGPLADFCEQRSAEG